MDIFFVVATIGLVVLTILVGIAIFYVIRLLRTLDSIAHTVEDEAEALKGDLDEARATIKRGGSSLLSLLGFADKTKKRLLTKKKRSS